MAPCPLASGRMLRQGTCRSRAIPLVLALAGHQGLPAKRRNTGRQTILLQFCAICHVPRNHCKYSIAPQRPAKTCGIGGIHSSASCPLGSAARVLFNRQSDLEMLEFLLRQPHGNYCTLLNRPNTMSILLGPWHGCVHVFTLLGCHSVPDRRPQYTNLGDTALIYHERRQVLAEYSCGNHINPFAYPCLAPCLM